MEIITIKYIIVDVIVIVIVIITVITAVATVVLSSSYHRHQPH